MLLWKLKSTQLLLLSSLPSVCTFSHFREPYFAFLLLSFLITTSFPLFSTCSLPHVLFIPAPNCIFHVQSNEFPVIDWHRMYKLAYVFVKLRFSDLFFLFETTRITMSIYLPSANNCVRFKTWCQRNQNKPGNNLIHQVYLFS